MDEKTLKQTAKEHGYNSDICVFLDKLEKNLQLLGIGKYCVEGSLSAGDPEYTVVKVALANIGRALSDFLPDDGEKSRNDYTTEDWAREGEAEFAKHCTPEGRFRYEDFKYLKREPRKPTGGLFDPLPDQVQSKS